MLEGVIAEGEQAWPGSQCSAAIVLAEAQRRAGRLAATIRTLESALETCPEAVLEQRAAYGILGLAKAYLNDFEGARKMSIILRSRAVSEVEQRQDEMVGLADDILSLVLLRQGNAQESAVVAQRSFERYVRAGAHDAAGYALNVKGMALLALSTEAAEPALKLAVSYCKKWNNFRGEAMSLFNRARLRQQQGNLAVAISDAARAMEMFAKLDAAEFRAATELVRGLRAVEASDTEKAQEAFSECRRLGEFAGDLYVAEL